MTLETCTGLITQQVIDLNEWQLRSNLLPGLSVLFYLIIRTLTECSY